MNQKYNETQKQGQGAKSNTNPLKSIKTPTPETRIHRDSLTTKKAGKNTQK